MGPVMLHHLYQSAVITTMLKNKTAPHSVGYHTSLYAHAHGLWFFCSSADLECATWEVLLQAVGPLGRGPGFRLGSVWFHVSC